MRLAPRIGFAVVGLGAIAQSSVLPCFARSTKAVLAGLVGRDKKQAGYLARKYRVRAFYGADEYPACLANPEIAAVYVATPPGEHSKLTIQAANAGKHVLCEKPLAARVEQSAQMVEACRRNGVLLMTAYRKHFEPGCLYLKELIQKGDLGRIDMIHTAFSELHSPGVSLPWLLDSNMAGGGPLTDLGVYCVNITRWLLEEDPVSVIAQTWVHDTMRFSDVEEGISFRLQFPNGTVVQGSSSYGAVLSSLVFLQGTKGWVSLTPAFPFDEERWLTGKIGKRRIERRFKIIDEFALEVDAFASSIQNKRNIEPDGVQGHRDMIILNAIYESARRQQPVLIGY
jgi:predicted dehydrogenase